MPPLGPAFLEEFANAVNGTQTTIVFHDLACPKARLMISVRFDPDTIRRYTEYFSTFDPYRAASLVRHRRASPETIYR